MTEKEILKILESMPVERQIETVKGIYEIAPEGLKEKILELLKEYLEN